jgi:hypothetical protein
MAERCGEDAALKRSVETLLAAHDRARDFLESPADVDRMAARILDLD